MKTYQQHYWSCREKYPTQSKTTVYDIAIHEDFILSRKRYLGWINKISKSVDNMFKDNTNIKNLNHSVLIEDFAKIESLEKLSKFVLSKVERYYFSSFGKIEFLHIYRNIISDKPLESSWLWHYDDCPDEFIKLGIYLTDTSVDTGAMEYYVDNNNHPIKISTSRIGPNKTINKMFPSSRVPPELLQNIGGSVSIVGGPGKNFLFTPNIIHRATMPQKGHRDAIFFFIRPCMQDQKENPLKDTKVNLGSYDVKEYKLD